MVPGDHPSVNRFERRAARARVLAGRYPASADALQFFARVSEFQNRGGSLEELRKLVVPLKPAEPWFQRVMEEIEDPVAPDSVDANECPQCGAPPQLGVLRPQGDGAALFLACASCRHEWPYRRSACPSCGAEGELAFYTSEEYPAVSTLTCDACQTFLHLIDIAKDVQAVPEADEIAALPLSAWATEQGYRKITENLAGI